MSVIGYKPGDSERGFETFTLREGLSVSFEEPRYPGENAVIQVISTADVQVGEYKKSPWIFVFTLKDYSEEPSVPNKDGIYAFLDTAYKTTESGERLVETFEGDVELPEAIQEAPLMLDVVDEVVTKPIETAQN